MYFTVMINNLQLNVLLAYDNQIERGRHDDGEPQTTGNGKCIQKICPDLVMPRPVCLPWPIRLLV